MTTDKLTLQDGMLRLGIDYEDLWQRYVAIGGNRSEAELRRHMGADGCIDDYEHNLIAQAINEGFVERGQNHPVAYRHSVSAETWPPTDG